MNFWWISESYKIAKETTLKKSLKKKKIGMFLIISAVMFKKKLNVFYIKFYRTIFDMVLEMDI